MIGNMMARLAIFGFVALFVSSCVASGIASRLDAADAQAESEVDNVVDFALKRLCSMPVDVLVRQARERGGDWTRGYFMMCPELRLLLREQPIRPTFS